MTRLFTEAIGRGPDAATWKANSLFSTTPSNCTSLDFYTIVNSIYTSAEYNNLGYTNQEKVITLYRGILNREPEAGAVQYWTNQLNGGATISSLVSNFVVSPEFASIRDNLICKALPANGNAAFRWGNYPALPVNAGEATMDSAWLQAQLNAAKTSASKTVLLPQRALIQANSTINIPPGVKLATVGTIHNQAYAKMARIVRTTNFAGPLITMGNMSTNTADPGNTGSSRIENIWISSQRDHVVNGTTISYIGQPTIAMYSGYGSSISNSRLENAVGGTNIEIFDYGCKDFVIYNNLITGYTNTHYSFAGDGRYTDGITIKCGSTTVTNNTVIDASDVGVITFFSPTQTQATKMENNFVIATGVSAYAAYMYEPWGAAAGESRVIFDFNGSTIKNNNFWGGPGTHFDIGISVGARAWHGSSVHVGKNGFVQGNSNQGIPTAMQIGIGIDSMPDTTVGSNALNYQLYNNGWCAKGVLLANTGYDTVAGVQVQNATPSRIASNTNNGSVVNYTNTAIQACAGHPASQ
ncbi:hypothetical protein GCM10027277_55130 [Pseudoduganella ginsengisoli]